MGSFAKGNLVAKPRFVDYSGAAPILLPVSIRHYWQGFYLPAEASDAVPDLEVPQGKFKICAEFDFKNPKTDYDRACSLGGVPAVQKVRVGPGYGLVFATERDSLCWWPEQQLLVCGEPLPDLNRLAAVAWTDECVWEATESDFLLINACEHGSDPNVADYFDVFLQPGIYVVQRGDYGWAGDDPALVLFRFRRTQGLDGGDRLA